MKKNGIFSRLFLLVLFLFLYAPIFVLIVFSFNDSKSNAVWGGFTLDWYVQLLNNRTVLSALQTTLTVSILATLIATVAGTAAAMAVKNGGTPRTVDASALRAELVKNGACL